MSSRDGLDDAEQQRLVRLALAEWSEAADAHVASIVASSDRVAVNLFVNGDYEYSVYFQRSEQGPWDEAGSGSGHMSRRDMDAHNSEV